MLRWLIVLLVILMLAAVATYNVAGRGAPPVVTIIKPDKVVGQTGSVDVTAQAPNARFTAISIAFEQNGKTVPLFTLDEKHPAGTDVTQAERNQVRISRAINRQVIPDLKSGAARIVVTATRPSFLNLVQLTATTSKDFQVRLEPPRIAVVSTHHYVNHGGSEMVVYKATPADVTSGVRVGDVEYLGFPAPVTNGTGADPSMKVAFFALLHDQPINAPIAAFARDEAGNQAKASFVDNVFEKPFKKSRIGLDDKFIERVVPEILEHSPELKIAPPQTATCGRSTRTRSSDSPRSRPRRVSGAGPSSNSATRRSKPASPTIALTRMPARRSINRSTWASTSPSRAASRSSLRTRGR